MSDGGGARAPASSAGPVLASLALPADFSLESTVLSHGYVQTAPFSWDGECLGRIDRLCPGGRARRVWMRQEGRELQVFARGVRRLPPEYLARVRRMLQLDCDLRSFHRLVRAEPRLRWMARRKFGRILTAGDLFEDVAKALCGTNVQWVQAVKMANRICTLGPRAGQDHAFPSPREVLRAGAGFLRQQARVGYRADYLLSLARDVDSGRLDAEALERDAAESDGESLRRRLLALQGIGPSTARYLSAFLGHFDAVSVDSAVIAFFERVHAPGRRPKPADVERHFERYGEHRGRVCWFEVWRDYRESRGLAL